MTKIITSKERFYDPKFRGIIFQVVLGIIVFSIVTILILNTQKNLADQNIASGFNFLKEEAGFEISESILDYWPDDSYQKALYVGILNTLKVGLLGNFLAITLGVFVGICRLSSNWILKKISQTYIELTRNIPLLLQLFFWYSVLTEVFPPVKEAWNPMPHVYLTQRGLYFPIFEDHPVWKWVLLFSGLAFVICLGLARWSNNQRIREGRERRMTPILLSLMFLTPLLVWFIGGAPSAISYPELGGFNFNGGYSLTPEFSALMIGLVLYTAAFNAEIVRAGIESVSKGQWEAGNSLGLSRWQCLRLIILPQSLRVIIPPMTSQILNLVKNSSLAVGIGYPDFVAVANTTMNQTGQAIEAVILIMAVYLTFSLTSSFVMNLYNKKIQVTQRGVL